MQENRKFVILESQVCVAGETGFYAPNCPHKTLSSNQHKRATIVNQSVYQNEKHGTSTKCAVLDDNNRNQKTSK